MPAYGITAKQHRLSLNYHIKIIDAGNQGNSLNLEATFKAASLEDAKDIILKLCHPYFKLGEGEELFLVETPEYTFKHMTYGICTGTAENWDCQGFVEIVDISTS